MELTSRDFDPKGKIPTRCSCDGEDHPPHLHWEGIPEGTAELARSDHLDLAPGSSINEMRRAMEGKVLDSAELVGVYAR
jgi:phosphatidylethanolamine-binding protein (PEBP) family uncharacterized protein